VTPVTGPFGPFTYTVATRSWWWSDGLFQIHGFAPGDVVPTTELLVSHKHPDDLEAAQQVIDRALGAGETFALWHRIVDAKRRVRNVVSVGDGVRDESGALREVRGFMVDVTESKRAETSRDVDEAVRRSAESRAAIEQAKGALMAACGLSEDQAFAALKTCSQHSNVKLRVVAELLVSGLGATAGSGEHPHERVTRILGQKIRMAPPAGAR
jgi:hypothetical protein